LKEIGEVLGVSESRVSQVSMVYRAVGEGRGQHGLGQKRGQSLWVPQSLRGNLHKLPPTGR
ncbi:hypothetical protein AB9U01_31370, partial [Pseudomonas qingdaonensis]|uniref:hypothetical protein n=1 Tax=Pseudomonas qingdaonensis TaxID=2056231 RepID=UPI003519A9C6